MSESKAKSWRLGLLLGVLSITLSLILAGCSLLSGPGPDATVERFMDAFNDRDFDVMLTCIEPKEEKMARAVGNLMGKLVGLDFKDALALMPFIVDMAVAEDKESTDLIFKYEILETQVDGKTAKVRVRVTTWDRKSNKATSEAEEGEINLRKFDPEGWRIIDL